MPGTTNSQLQELLRRIKHASRQLTIQWPLTKGVGDGHQWDQRLTALREAIAHYWDARTELKALRKPFELLARLKQEARKRIEQARAAALSNRQQKMLKAYERALAEGCGVTNQSLRRLIERIERMTKRLEDQWLT